MSQISKENELDDWLDIKHDGIQDMSEISAEKIGNLSFGAILSEPNFSIAHLPWHNLFFWFMLDQIQAQNGSECKILPQSASLWAVPVSFKVQS